MPRLDPLRKFIPFAAVTGICSFGIVYITCQKIDYRRYRQKAITLDSIGFETEVNRHINKVKSHHEDPAVEAQLRQQKRLLKEVSAVSQEREYDIKPVPKPADLR